MEAAFIAIVLALLIGLAVSQAAYRPKHIDVLKSDIAKAKKQHKARRHLWKQLVEARRRELEEV